MRQRKTVAANTKPERDESISRKLRQIAALFIPFFFFEEFFPRAVRTTMLLSLTLRNGRSILTKGVQTHLYPKDRGVLIDTAAVTFQDTASKKLKWSYSSFPFSTTGSKETFEIDKKRLEDPRVETRSTTFSWAVS